MRIALLAFLIAFCIFSAALEASPKLQTPRSRGHLILIGGGKKPSKVLHKFVALAGGPSSPIVVIPTASSLSDTGSYYEELFAEEAGCKKVKVLPIETREDAENADYVAAIDKACGLFFSGGDQSRITSALSDSPSGNAIARLYERGGVIGGTSAGTACQSKLMITGNGDFSVIKEKNVELKPGLGLFPAIIIDQHFIARQRQNRLISVILENPLLLGVGVDEASAVWLKPNLTFEVLGESSVFVYDASKATIRRSKESSERPGRGYLGVTGLRTHILLPGDRFSLARRTVVDG